MHRLIVFNSVFHVCVSRETWRKIRGLEESTNKFDVSLQPLLSVSEGENSATSQSTQVRRDYWVLLLISLGVVALSVLIITGFIIPGFKKEFCVDETLGFHNMTDYASKCTWCGNDADCEDLTVFGWKKYWVALNTMPNVVFLHAVLKSAALFWAHSNQPFHLRLDKYNVFIHQKRGPTGSVGNPGNRFKQIQDNVKLSGFDLLITIIIIYSSLVEIFSINMILIALNRWMIVV